MDRNNIALISIGSNMGNREHFMEQAILELHLHPEIRVLEQSVIMETEALEVTSQPDFLNAVIKISTSLSPLMLLETTQSIENKLGRVRRFDKGPREIDLDILTYGNVSLQTEKLTLPHHSLFTRPFVRKLIETLAFSYYRTGS